MNILRLSFAAILMPLILQAQHTAPNIVWITCEDISPFIGCYGDKTVKTPNIDQLAREGVRYTNVYTTAGVCAPSRSAIITGMYQTSIGTQHMRTLFPAETAKRIGIPAYSAVIPDYVKCFPEYLRRAGYYCTNNEKQDYQFIPPVTVWDENSLAASYRNRPKEKPFFSVFNLAVTHESQLYMREKDSLFVDPSSVKVPPFYPDTKTVRRCIARNYTNIEIMDAQVGEIIRGLKEDGLYNNTIIFFFSDHGGALPWYKRELLERGIHIPLIIHFPGGANAGTSNDDLISAVDFAPTILSLAGIPVPAYMQGQAFLGEQKNKTPRKYVFAGRDRMDTEYDRVRAVKDKQFEYLYNFEPAKPHYQNIEYRLSIPMMKEIIALRDSGQLDSIPMTWFDTKPVEELYDVKNDPDELHNLAADPAYRHKREELKGALMSWLNNTGDMGAMPEKEMLANWWKHDTTPPLTDPPLITAAGAGVTISCATRGASVGYRIIRTGSDTTPVMHEVRSWDFGTMPGRKKGLKELPAPPVWNVYKGEVIVLNKGEVLMVKALRIGYKEADATYTKM
ncbi:sulfatase [Parafilimonas sp.]|uniref:sulfatase family protein n=1 Tax=Parafilimonas sp. TaxID=1969739 RepID=UPI0039E4E869